MDSYPLQRGIGYHEDSTQSLKTSQSSNSVLNAFDRIYDHDSEHYYAMLKITCQMCTSQCMNRLRCVTVFDELSYSKFAMEPNYVLPALRSTVLHSFQAVPLILPVLASLWQSLRIPRAFLCIVAGRKGLELCESLVICEESLRTKI